MWKILTALNLFFLCLNIATSAHWVLIALTGIGFGVSIANWVIDAE